MTDDTQPLPPGDELHFDGEHLTVGGQRLAPGRYAAPGGRYVIEVYDHADDEHQDYTD